ncbi:uncharacterized protein METZ01_LOCUS441294 [marine metagenome]|uniref:Uncharacterized protein n=1 Tax=marine metagenome TaxID=408172 RepID=A0A382YZD1_9ZZZZ
MSLLKKNDNTLVDIETLLIFVIISLKIIISFG